MQTITEKGHMSEADFFRLSSFINSICGIKLPIAKKVMLESRLQKRLHILKFSSFQQYCNFVLNDPGGEPEIVHMIDMVSTNKTDFFREPAHFEYLRQWILQELGQKIPKGKRLKIWSAGCSSGEEPYTLAIVLYEFSLQYGYIPFEILGTDISTHVLLKAQKAVYDESRIATLPLNIRKKYFLKSKDDNLKLVKVKPILREKVTFRRLNFMDESYLEKEVFDIIFCRNVLIYFERKKQEEVINNLCSNLRQGGYFFLGHSESTMGMNVPLQQIRPTVFRRV